MTGQSTGVSPASARPEARHRPGRSPPEPATCSTTAERMGVDELRALQLERLRWTLRHAYDNVPHYRARLRRRRRAPRRPAATLADLARFPFTTQGRPAGELPVRHVRRAARAGRAGCTPRSGTTGRPTVVGYTARGHRHLGRGHGPLDPRGRRAAGRRGARRVRLRAVHRRARRALRRGGARLHGRPGLRRHDRAAGAADPRLPAAGDHGDAVVLPGRPRRDRGAGPRPGGDLARDRHLRRRAVDRRRCAHEIEDARRACTRSTSTGCPR